MKHELLHEKAILKAKAFHRAEIELIDVLQEVDANASVPGTEPKMQQNIPGSRRLSAQTKHQVNLRDQGQCTNVHEGKRCENKRWLETHHQIPLSQGGYNSLSNLTTLCWSHHRMRH